MFLCFIGQEIIHNPTTEGISPETATSPQFLTSDQGLFFIPVHQIEKEKNQERLIVGSQISNF